MSEPIVAPTTNGQELQLTDVDLLGAVAGLADDRVIAELLRLPAFTTVPAKCVLPYTTPPSGNNTPNPNATVQPSGSANGSIVVQPFRFIVGSRAAQNAAPPTNPMNTTAYALANWRDVRSGIFIGSATSLSQSITLAPNASGSPRWDLVYATMAPDVAGPSVTRRVKSATGTIGTASLPAYLQAPVSVSVVTGTPGAIPAQPALPADAGGNYNVALALVRVPNGFSGTTTISARDIRTLLSTGASFKDLRAPGIRPGNGNNDANNSNGSSGNVFNTSGNPFYYAPATAGQRPGPFCPADWIGDARLFFEIDNSSASNSNWSHGGGCIVDSSIDWRNRIIKVHACVQNVASVGGFANDPLASGTCLPFAALAGSPVVTVMGNTLKLDGGLVASRSTVLYCSQTNYPAMATGSVAGLYVDSNTGNLLWYANGTASQAFFFIWVEATGQMPNP